MHTHITIIEFGSFTIEIIYGNILREKNKIHEIHIFEGVLIIMHVNMDRLH